MKLYMIRHGQSETNGRGFWTGWLDVALTERGREDAKAARAVLKDIPFDKVYSSDLKRAMQTAEIALPGCSYEPLPLLREINVGSLQGTEIGLLTKEERARALAEGYQPWGGESRAEHRQRMRAFLERLQETDDETVAVFAHGGCLKSMLCEVLGVTFSFDAVRCDNCAVAVFEQADGKWRLQSWINTR